MSYIPSRDGCLEKFLGSIGSVFTQLEEINNQVSDPLKLGIIRNALLRGSNKYNDTLKFCELQRENYVQTIQRLHDLENQASLNKMHKKINNDERINNTAETKQNTNLKDVTCFNCGAKGHYKKDCPRDKNSSSSV